MTRHQTAQALAGVSALGFVVAAVLHASDYRGVVQQAQQGFAGLSPFVATLWLAYAAALLVLGGIVTVVALGRAKGGRWVLALAGCLPLITVILQLQFLGFTRSTTVLAAVAALSFGAALASPADA